MGAQIATEMTSDTRNGGGRSHLPVEATGVPV